MSRCVRHQIGVALITALLVVALVTTLVATMLSRQQIELRRVTNRLEADQIRLHAQGMADWACQLLARDRRAGRTDHLNEPWAQVLPPVPIDHGELAGFLEDQQGRFNLNSLLREGQPDPLAAARLRRLFAQFGVDPELVDGVIDWLDPDLEPTLPEGAEDGQYLGQTPPYRAANRLMVSPSELLLVRGLDGPGFRRLQPHLSALPRATEINLNTATLAVLRSLADDLSEADARQLIAGRGREGYRSVAQFLAQPVLKGRELPAEGLGVASDFFLATGDLRYGQLRQRHYSLLQRGPTGSTRVLAHFVGSY